MRHQRGFLLLVAVVIIVILAILSTTLVAMFVRAGSATALFVSANKATYVTESGLQQGQKNLTQPIMASRQTCTGLSNTTSMSTGSFTVARATDTANSTNPRYAFATLTTGISAAASPSTIVVNSSAVFAPYGRVLIGREVFSYERIANATTLAGITRADDGSMQTTHSSGDIVSQFQCVIQSSGNSPATNTLGARQYRQSIQLPTVFASGASGTILHWNSDAAELSWVTNSSGTSLSLNGISVLNYHTGWAVGNAPNANTFLIARLQGNTWTASNILSSGNGVNLFGVSTTSNREAWAVGTKKGNGANTEFTMLRWTGSGWTRLTTAANCGSSTLCIDRTNINATDRELYAIQMLDYTGDGFADFGIAVGGNSLGNTLIYDASTLRWEALLTYASGDRIGRLRGVSYVKNGSSFPTEVFVVGTRSPANGTGKLIKLTRSGSTWSYAIQVNTVAPMNSVSVIDTDGDGIANFGIAVGDAGTVYLYNGSSWSAQTVGGNDLLSVMVLSSTEAWAVGDNGTRYHYNGTSWVSIPTGVSTSNTLNAVSAVFPQNPASAWYDVIN